MKALPSIEKSGTAHNVISGGKKWSVQQHNCDGLKCSMKANHDRTKRWDLNWKFTNAYELNEI
jgi:hypothetical protein